MQLNVIRADDEMTELALVGKLDIAGVHAIDMKFHVMTEAEGFLKRQGASARAVSRVLIILEEVILNLIKYAASVTQDIDVRLEVAADRVVTQIVDDGAPFDPRSAPEFDKTTPLEERGP